MKTDITIAQEAKLKLVADLAKQAGIKLSEVELHGCYKAKINLSALRRLSKKKDGQLVLVTAMTPTPQGEGKTTTTVGLAQALRRLGHQAWVCVREPSLGPVMGMKGGAAGGGYSQVLPMDDINLHLTGDMHMITSAHNLLTALVYNHLYHGNELAIDANRITWKRVMDMNDRYLRGMFDITASSEVMAVLCLSRSIEDMKKKLGEIIVAYDGDGRAIRAKDLKAAGAMAMLMWHALKPNLVQTLEGGPAFVHGGPFANIAHGCNSLIATQLALKLSDYVITEAGFGTDLGAEKFFDIKCRIGKLKPAAAVLVVTKQAIERHGYDNVAKHVENLKLFGVPVIIAINRKSSDTDQTIGEIKKRCSRLGAEVAVSEVWAKGGRGGRELAQAVISATKKESTFKPLYKLELSIRQKIEIIAEQIYGASAVDFTEQAHADLELLSRIGFTRVPVCIAKTQYSLSDDPKVFGRPQDFHVTIRAIKPSAGAGFAVAYAGSIMTMPGLPAHPAAEKMDITEEGKITGLF